MARTPSRLSIREVSGYCWSMKRSHFWWMQALVLPMALGCGGNDSPPPADLAGSYTISLTNGPNPCNISGWTAGAQIQGVPLTITQSGDHATAKVGGVGSVFLLAVSGSDTFEGTVSGAALDLELHGTAAQKSGTCTFTIDVRLRGTLTNDLLEGTVDYTANTTSSAECMALHACSERQDFNGTRPPRAR